jgi:hypothetical protein
LGQSRNNPLSPAYNGDLPDELVGAKVTMQVEMAAEFQLRVAMWQQDPLNLGQEPPFKPGPDDVRAAFYITGTLVRPSALIADRSKWPSGEATMGKLFDMPYSDYIGRIEDANPHLKTTPREDDGGAKQ